MCPGLPGARPSSRRRSWLLVTSTATVKRMGTTTRPLLDYVTGKRASIQNLQHGDLDGNGKVETYDAHLLLQKLRNDTTVSVPAGGSVEIQVSVRLTQKAREFLTDYVGGAYVEAFVNAKALADEEGVVGASHSIPVLAYYGSWTDASMFDVGSYMEYSGNAEYRTPYLGNPNANFYGITYGGYPRFCILLWRQPRSGRIL